MKKRIPYLLMSMAMVFAFASCDAHAHTDLKPETSGEYSPTVHDKVESFNITESNVSLTVGATHQLKAHFQPIFQETPSISYTSNNPSVVAVDASGKLTAKSSGFAIITGNCGDFSSQCYVSVTPEDTLEKGTQNLKTIANAQGHSSYESPTYLKAMTASFSTLYQDGVVKTSSTNFETMYIDTEEAYVRMTDSYYAKTKTQGGVAEITLGEWIIYCTSSFETFLFHVEHGVKP